MSENMQRKAYEAGLEDGRQAGVIPDARTIQRQQDCDGEELVCYLNGVGDGIAGLNGRS